jgi:acyl carrier protein
MIAPLPNASIEMTTLTTVQKLIAEELDLAVDDLDPARPLDELGIDSLSVMEVMFKLEDTFDIKMPDERVPIRTVQDIADIVDRLLRERGSGIGPG